VTQVQAFTEQGECPVCGKIQVLKLVPGGVEAVLPSHGKPKCAGSDQLPLSAVFTPNPVLEEWRTG